jgi:cytidine deaminase
MEEKSQVHIVEDIERTSSAEISKVINENQKLVDICNGIRHRIVHPPSQSNFRVVALFIVEHTVYTGVTETSQQQEISSSLASSAAVRRLSFVCGSNAEQGYIGGAICAERATLTRLRFYENVIIQKIAITTDSEHAISPGALCREYLMTAAPSTTPVVLGNASGKQVVECQLSDFYPFPYVYRHCLRCDIVSSAEIFAKNMMASTSVSSKVKLEEQFPYLPMLLKTAKEVNLYDNDERSIGIHPVAMSGAVIFSNERIINSWQLKALEYGCTIGPIVQLIGRMKQYPLEVKEKSEENVTPLMIVMIDQFNVCHAPFAAARTLLVELGYGDLNVLLHNSGGELVVVKAKDLYPVTTGLVGNNLSHDDFR